MTRQKKCIISIILFVLVFGSLLAVATVYDLQISQFLTRSSLAEHQYHTNDPFAAAFEIIGSIPVYLMISFALHVGFWYAAYNWSGFVQKLFYALTLGFSAVSYYVMADDTIGYLRPHLAISDPSFHTTGGTYLTIVHIIFAVIANLAGVMVVKNIRKRTINRMLGFAIAMIIMAALPTILINLVIKEPVGRIRFRAMNMYPDNPTYGFAAFAKWFEVNGQWIDREKMNALFGTTDALKSFPSGHTAGAAMTYGLTMLVDAMHIRDKAGKAFLYIFPIVFTGIVAVSRIVAGAHFMSDVLIGGTMTYVTMIIVREIFVCRGKNVRAILGKDKEDN